MTTESIFAACALLSYLLGAVPFGLLVARARGVDIRKHGSGNIGATNVLRTLGKGPGILTFVCDAVKGYSPTMLGPLVCARWLPPASLPALALVCGAGAIAGHNWPVYLRFKGGKGVATSTGALLGIAPLAVLCGLAVWLVTFKISRYVSLASILAAAAIPCAAWAAWAAAGRQTPLLVPAVLTLLAATIILRHRSNLGRLLKGSESRFPSRRQKQGEDQSR